MKPHLALLGLLVLCLSSCQAPLRYIYPDDYVEPVSEVVPTRKDVPAGKIDRIEIEELFALNESGQILLIDARPAHLYSAGHIPGAYNVSARGNLAHYNRLQPKIDQAVREGKTVVTYCTGVMCSDAKRLARIISADGYPVSIFTRGWNAWLDAGLPTESASHAP